MSEREIKQSLHHLHGALGTLRSVRGRPGPRAGPARRHWWAGGHGFGAQWSRALLRGAWTGVPAPPDKVAHPPGGHGAGRNPRPLRWVGGWPSHCVTVTVSPVLCPLCASAS